MRLSDKVVELNDIITEYKAALERIAEYNCVCNSLGISSEGCDCPCCIANKALGMEHILQL